MGYHILGNFREQPLCQIPENYFQERDCWIDCRAPGMLQIHAEANIGWEVKLICQTHNTDPDMFGDVQGRPIIIHKKAFICAFAILYNCEIGEGAIVAAGSVVRSQKVPPWTMVAGNPAVPIKKFNPETRKWEKV